MRMYEYLSRLLSDQKGDVVFSCFGVWHWLYMLVIFGMILLVMVHLKNKSAKAKQSAIRFAINGAFGLYIADFFLMPFAYGEMDLEKLPFHICTAMCVMGFLSRHTSFWGRFKSQFALLGLVSNLIYLIYPAGVGWYQIHPLSYRVIQTLLFHGFMSAYGLFVLAFDDTRLEWKTCYKDLPIIVAMTAWALLGNTLYNGEYNGYAHHFNWFFVTQDPFYMIPADIAPYIMPFVMIGVVFLLDVLVYTVYHIVKKVRA